MSNSTIPQGAVWFNADEAYDRIIKEVGKTPAKGRDHLVSDLLNAYSQLLRFRVLDSNQKARERKELFGVIVKDAINLKIDCWPSRNTLPARYSRSRTCHAGSHFWVSSAASPSKPRFWSGRTAARGRGLNAHCWNGLRLKCCPRCMKKTLARKSGPQTARPWCQVY